MLQVATKDRYIAFGDQQVLSIMKLISLSIQLYLIYIKDS